MCFAREKIVENKNNTAIDGVSLTTPKVGTVSVAAASAPPAGMTVSPLSEPVAAPPPVKRPHLKRRYVIGSILLAIILLVGAGAVLLNMRPSTTVNSNEDALDTAEIAARYNPLSVSLDDLAKSGGISLDGTASLAVNGQLRVNNAFIISPSAQPKNGVAGQIYYDTTSNELRYFNGEEFTSLLDDGAAVQSIGGLSGDVALGPNLSIVNGTLTTTTGGVLSVQGQTGNVQFTGGPGIAIDGTTLSNTGVTTLGNTNGDISLGSGLSIAGGVLRNSGVNSLTAGTLNLSIVDDGQGNLTISSVGGGAATVSSPGGTAGRIAKFTGVQTIADSLLSESGAAVTVNGDLNVTGATTLTTPLAVTSGGTGANNAASARTNLGAAASGANSDITSLSGLTTALSVLQGGTGATTLTANGVLLGNGSSPVGSLAAGGAGLCLISTAGAPSWQACPGGGGVVDVNGLTGSVTIANATAGGGTVTIDDASTSQKGIAQFNSTNFSAAAGVINTAQDINVTAAPTFGRLTVTSSQATNDMLLVNNTNAGATGNLIDLQQSGVSRMRVSPAGAMTLTGTINGQTISSAASLTGTLAVAGQANLNGGASVTGTLNANTITPTAAMTVGATNQSFTLQGNASSTLTATSGANTTTVAFQAPTANVTYRLLTAAAGTYDICTTVGNCAGVGGGVTTPGGTTNRIAKFSGAQAIADSIITDDGSTVTIGGTLAVNTIAPSAAMTVGATAQDLTLQGAVTNLTSTAGGFTNALTFATPAGSNKTITLPNATGTVAVSAVGPLQLSATGAISCPTCVTSGGGGGGVGAVDSLNGLTGALTINNATTGGSSITINDASTAQKGIAQFNSTNFSAASGIINTIQDINTTAAPTFGRLTVTSSQATNDMMVVNNTNGAGSGSLLALQLNGANRFTVDPAGNVVANGTVTSGAINGQTISSAASFTGTIGAVGNISTSAALFANSAGITTNLNVSGTTFTGDLSVTNDAGVGGNLNVVGAVSTNTITSTGALTIGDVAQAFTLQGTASSVITATNAGSTTSLAFQTPTANVTYRLLTAAAGTYDVCTTAGNCTGGGLTGSGTSGKIAKYTGANTLADSILTESGTTVTAAGNLNVTTGNQFQINGVQISSAALSNDANLAKLDATQTFTGATNTFKNTSDSTTALQIQNSTSGILMNADTSNMRLYIGDPAGGATTSLLVLGNQTNAADPTGVEGAMYYNNTTKQFRCYRDGAWEACGIDPIDRGFILQEEFMGGSSANCTNNGAYGSLGWSCNNITGGTNTIAYNQDIAPTVDRPGSVRIRPSTTLNSGATLVMSQTGAGSMTIAAGNTIKAAAAVASATSGTTTMRVGMSTQAGAITAPNTGVWWEADPTVNANWQYCYGNGSAAVCAASGVAIAANTYARLEIRVNATGASTSSATFLINGNSSTVSSVTIATASAVSPNIVCYAQDATQQPCYVDYYQIRGVATAAR